jgi:hypothetical protein
MHVLVLVSSLIQMPRVKIFEKADVYSAAHTTLLLCASQLQKRESEIKHSCFELLI